MTNAGKATTGSVAFIGGGNMARSLVGGLVARGHARDAIHVADPVAAARDALARDFGVQVHATGADAVAGAETWVFAVKPQVMREVCATLAGQAQAAKPLVVSIAAGITSDQLDRWLGGGLPVVRTMPNTPALLGASRMLVEGDADATELRRRVTSPNGTTQAAIETFEAGGFRELVRRAIHAARERGRELSGAND